MSSPPEHPDPEAIARFMSGEGAVKEDNRRIMIHLLRGCPACRAKVLAHLGPNLEPAMEEEA